LDEIDSLEAVLTPPIWPEERAGARLGEAARGFEGFQQLQKRLQAIFFNGL